MITVSFNGSTYQIPQNLEARGTWGLAATTYLQALSTGSLQKNGGLQALTADINLGASYGVIAAYLKSTAANIAASGVVRLASTDKITFRNTANSADIPLGLDGSDNLTFNGVALVSSAGQIPAARVGAGTVDDTEFGYLDGVASAIQPQLNAKAATSALTAHTGASTGVHGVAGSVVGTTDTQTLSAKTLASPFITGSTDFTQISTPTTPATGHNKFYPKADGKFYNLNEFGIESAVGSGSGGGVKNYISNPNDAATWATSNVSLLTIATSTSTSRPDNITQTNAIIITRASGSAYVYARFTLDSADYNKKLALLWDQAYAGTAGDYTVSVYSNTAANYTGTSTQLVTPVSNIPAGTFSFNTTFDSPGSAAPYIEVRITGVANTLPLYLNNVTVTPGVITQGAAVSGAITFTPTLSASFGTTTIREAYYYRIGSRMSGVLVFKAGTVTAAQATFTVPGGFTLDTSLTGNAGAGNQWVNFGDWHSSNSSGTGGLWIASGAGVITTNSTSNTVLSFSAQPATDASGDAVQTSANASTIVNSNATLTVTFEIPIAEWAGNGTVNLGAGAQVEYASNSSTSTTASDTTSFSTGLNQIKAITVGLSRRVRFQYPIQANDILMPQVSFDGIIWSDMDSFEVTPKGGTGYFLNEWHRQNATQYGFGRAQPVAGTTTDVDVSFGPYSLSNGATFGSAGQSWATGGGLGDLYWRVKKCTASAPVGFGLASATAAGLVTLPSSEIRLYGSNASGGSSSGETMIQNYGTLISNVGTAITYTPKTTTTADKFTVNEAGIYAISATMYNPTNYIGISKNSSQLSTGIYTITAADCLMITNNLTTGDAVEVSVTARLAAGDVIRAHRNSTTATATATDAAYRFTMTQVVKL